jgi:DNA mismatch endonuclease (patch repair protein)
MVDSFSAKDRSRIMSRIRGKDTTPELFVRRSVTALGYRYRLHRRDLPGSPDLVFPAKLKVIFVNGCFWHLHSCKRGQSAPATNRLYWVRKREANAARDRRASRKLRSLGWRVLTVWECHIGRAGLSERLKRFLTSE